jgi:hypothetical protein
MNRRELVVMLNSLGANDAPVMLKKGPTGQIAEVGQVTYDRENNRILIVAAGSVGGRPRAELTTEQAHAAVEKHASISAAARELNVPRSTLQGRLNR